MSRVTVSQHRFHRIAPAAITLGLALMLVQSGSAIASSGTNVDALKQGIVANSANATTTSTTLGPFAGQPLTNVYVDGQMSFGAKHLSSVASPWGSANQFYPPNLSGPGDFGILVRFNSILYAPNFAGQGGSAAAGVLGATTPWAPVSQVVTNAGHTVTTTATAGVLRLVVATNYTDGDGFFTHDMTFTNTGVPAISFDAFLASDLYTSGSDAGRPDLRGGTTCANDRQITHSSLPISTLHQSGGWAVIWNQIRTGDLLNTVDPTNCVDNGAALEWKVASLAGGASTAILSKTTFGNSPAYVPSVTTWGIMLLTTLLASVGILALKKRNNGSLSA